MSQPDITDLDRVAVTLSAIAYLAVDASHTERFKAMARALQNDNLPTKQQWGLVWGPHEFHQFLVFVAQGPQTQFGRHYAVVIRGTIDSIYDFFDDLDVWWQSDMPWSDPDLPGAKLADGTINAWKDLRGLSQHVGGRDQTLLDFLRGVDSGSAVMVTGHSLGGNLASAVADWLRVELNLPRKFVGITPVTFAGPTAGNAAFAGPYGKVFPTGKRFVNDLDLIPRAWAHDDLKSIYDMYPGEGAPKCDIENGCETLTAAALEFVGHEYEQPGGKVVLNSRLYSESGNWFPFYDEALAQHSCLLYMYLMGVPLKAIHELYPNEHWQPPKGL